MDVPRTMTAAHESCWTSHSHFPWTSSAVFATTTARIFTELMTPTAGCCTLSLGCTTKTSRFHSGWSTAQSTHLGHRVNRACGRRSGRFRFRHNQDSGKPYTVGVGNHSCCGPPDGIGPSARELKTGRRGMDTNRAPISLPRASDERSVDCRITVPHEPMVQAKSKKPCSFRRLFVAGAVVGS